MGHQHQRPRLQPQPQEPRERRPPKQAEKVQQTWQRGKAQKTQERQEHRAAPGGVLCYGIRRRPDGRYDLICHLALECSRDRSRDELFAHSPTAAIRSMMSVYYASSS